MPAGVPAPRLDFLPVPAGHHLLASTSSATPTAPSAPRSPSSSPCATSTSTATRRASRGSPPALARPACFDCSIMKTWNLASMVDDIAFVRSQIESLHPGTKIVTGGASLGGILATAVGNRDSAITRLPAQVDDRVDVLDVDRALPDARAARHAVPDDLVASPRSARAAAARRRPCRRGRQDRRCLAATWSRSCMISSFGLSGLPVAHAGQTSWQRPHSVHENRSSSCCRDRSSAVATPNRISASAASRSISRCSRLPLGRFFADQTLGAAVMMCRCLEASAGRRGTQHDQQVRPHEDRVRRSRWSDRRRTGPTARPRPGPGSSARPSAIRDAFHNSSVATIAVIASRMRSASPR